MTAADVVATMRGQMEQASTAPTLFDQMESLAPQVERALGSADAAQRLIRVALTQVRRTPKLAACTFTSIAGAILTSGQLRLDPGQPLGHAWFVPMDNRHKVGPNDWETRTECEWWLGYTGIVELARRTGRVGQLHAAVVREHDRFEVTRGSRGGLVHDFDWKLRSADRGEVVAAYCYWDYPGGGSDWTVKSIEDIHDQHRAKSRAWQYAEKGKRDSPWHTDYDAMVAKSMVRASLPWLPSSTDLADGAAADERVVTWDPARPGVPPSADDDTDLQAAYQPEEGPDAP